MQSVTETYKSLWSNLHTIDVKVNINGIDYDSSQIFSMSTTRTMFNENTPVIGSCVSSEIDVEIINPVASIPPMAEIRPYVRIVGEGGVSEWVCKGIYYIDTRRNTRNPRGINRLTIHGFDAMLKLSGRATAVMPYLFPMSATSFLNRLTTLYGIQYDRVQLYNLASRLSSITIPKPEKRTLRELLGYIGFKLSGNWVIDEVNGDSADKTYGLKFIPFGNIDEGVGLLVDEMGNYLKFGGDRIIV